MLIWKYQSPHLGKMYNQIYEQTKFKDAIVSMVGDDMEWRTSGYDLAILNAINRKNGFAFVYCNDKFQGNKLCVNLFTTRKLVELTKMPFMCELFSAYFIDTVWMRVADKTKIAVYLKDIILQHHHASFNKKNKDETSRRLQRERMSFSKGHKKVNLYADKIIKHLRNKL